MNPKENRVLVADDDPLARRLLQRSLLNWGFTVVEAEDGEEALSLLESGTAPPVAILDWMMPKIDGPEICARVREHPNRPYVYLILLTAKNKKADIAEGLRSGADNYLWKPFDPSELRARLLAGQRMVALERTLSEKVAALERALGDVRKLKSLLPICMYCKSIRDDDNYWQAVDAYVHQHAGTDFSHGICPACMAKIEAHELDFYDEATGMRIASPGFLGASPR